MTWIWYKIRRQAVYIYSSIAFSLLQHSYQTWMSGNRPANLNESSCVLHHQAFGVQVLDMRSFLDTVRTSRSVHGMKLKQRGHFVFSICHTTVQTSITFILMCEFNFTRWPFAYFVCKVYEKVLITFGIEIPTKCCWEDLILTRSNAIQYEN
jgi:hypothetical protein